MRLVAIADGPLWLQRARFYLSPLIRPSLAVQRITGHRADGGRGSILVAGDSPAQRLLLAELLPQDGRIERLGRVSLRALPALLRREMPNHDLAIARIPQVLWRPGRWTECLFTDWLFMPEVVDMRVRVDEVERRRKLGRGTVAGAYRRWRQHGFSATISRDRASFDLFYELMYLRYTRARFGNAASVRARRALRRVHDRGAVLWVEKDGRRLAARLVAEDGNALHAMSVGTNLDPHAAAAQGAMTAATLAAIDHAAAAGLAWVHLGGCMPWLTDGVLLNKQRWGAELVRRSWLSKGLLVAWPRWTPLAADFLALAPIFEIGDRLHGVATTARRVAQPPEGLHRLHLVDDAEDGPSIAPADPGTGCTTSRLAPAGSPEILAQIGATSAGSDARGFGADHDSFQASPDLADQRD